MYKIIKNNTFSFVEISNCDEILQDFNFTRLEKELRECIESDFNSRIFFNSTKLECESKFWKLSSETEIITTIVDNEVKKYSFNKIVEMSDLEKNLILEEEERKRVNDSYYNFKYHIGIYDLTLLCLLVPELVSRIEELKTANGTYTKYISSQIQDPISKKFITVVDLFIDNKDIEGIDQLLSLTTTDFEGNTKNLVTIYPDNPLK